MFKNPGAMDDVVFQHFVHRLQNFRLWRHQLGNEEGLGICSERLVAAPAWPAKTAANTNVIQGFLVLPGMRTRKRTLNKESAGIYVPTSGRKWKDARHLARVSPFSRRRPSLTTAQRKQSSARREFSTFFHSFRKVEIKNLTNLINLLHSFFRGSSIRNGSGTASFPCWRWGHTSMGVFANLIRTLSRSACDVTQADFLLSITPFSQHLPASPVRFLQLNLKSNQDFIAQLFFEEAA